MSQETLYWTFLAAATFFSIAGWALVALDRAVFPPVETPERSEAE